MEIKLDCLPCMLRQVLGASRMATDDTALQEKIMTEAAGILSDYKKYTCSPELAFAMHRTVKLHTGNPDPYEKVKCKDIKAAKKIYPFLKSFLQEKGGGCYWALKISATGNIIDSAVNSDTDIENCVITELEKPFIIYDISNFEDKLKKAETVLIIGDNAGETVFDAVLIEYLLRFDVKIFYAVRSNPIINDATRKEAEESGFDARITIISTGCGAPGAILDRCSDDFTELFNKSDLVISKGQGNYEALSDCGRNVFFLLKAKCPVISNRLGVNVNDYVFKEI